MSSSSISSSSSMWITPTPINREIPARTTTSYQHTYLSADDFKTQLEEKITPNKDVSDAAQKMINWANTARTIAFVVGIILFIGSLVILPFLVPVMGGAVVALTLPIVFAGSCLMAESAVPTSSIWSRKQLAELKVEHLIFKENKTTQDIKDLAANLIDSYSYNSIVVSRSAPEDHQTPRIAYRSEPWECLYAWEIPQNQQ